MSEKEDTDEATKIINLMSFYVPVGILTGLVFGIFGCPEFQIAITASIIILTMIHLTMLITLITLRAKEEIESNIKKRRKSK